MNEAPANLDRTLLRGLSWNATGRWVGQLVSWASTLIVVRLLTPADYGLVAMGGVLFSLIGAVADGGIRSAIVNRRESDAKRLHQLTAVCVFIGFGMTLIAWIIAVPLARYFDEPKLVPVVAVTSLTYTVLGFRMVPLAVLQRSLDYRTMAANDLLMVVATALASVTIASLGGGYWALIVGHVAGSTIATVAAWRSAPQAIARPVWSEIQETVRFGSHLLVSQLSGWARSEADSLIIGRFVGRAPLGAYKVAMETASIPLEKAGGVLVQVSGPIFAAVKSEPAALARYLLLITEALAAVVWPLAVGLVLTADVAIPVLLGDQWTSAVVPLQIFAGAAVLRVITSPLSSVALARDRSRLIATTSLVISTVVIGAMLFGVHWGVPGVAAAWAIGPLATYSVMLRACLTEVGIPLVRYAQAVRTALIACTGMAFMVPAVRAALPHGAPAGIALLVMSAVGAVSYLLIFWLLARRRIKQIIRTIWPKRNAA